MPYKKSNCETSCKNINRKVKAPRTVEDSFKKGEEINICQLCRNGDHYKE